MLPAALMVLPALPLTPNGKVDRRALPPPDDMVAEPTTTHRPADTPTEETIAGIWQQVLGMTRVGATDNFFALGGHSLLATQVIARVRSAFGLELPLRVLFEAPTVAGLAERVDAGRRLLHEIAGLSGAEVRDRLADGRPGA
jgi:acyl carrier protein